MKEIIIAIIKGVVKIIVAIIDYFKGKDKQTDPANDGDRVETGFSQDDGPIDSKPVLYMDRSSEDISAGNRFVKGIEELEKVDIRDPKYAEEVAAYLMMDRDLKDVSIERRG